MGVQVTTITHDQVEADRATIHNLVAEARRLILDAEGQTSDGQDKRLLLVWIAKFAADHAVDLRLDPMIAGIMDRVAKRQAAERAQVAR